MVRSFFPSLFEFGVASVNFSDVVVSRSEVNPNCVIIKARKPVEFLLETVANQGLSGGFLDKISFKYNTDRSLSVFDK